MISEERILQISNDISENEDNPVTKKELKEVVRYWMVAHTDEVSRRSVSAAERTSELVEQIANRLKFTARAHKQFTAKKLKQKLHN